MPPDLDDPGPGSMDRLVDESAKHANNPLYPPNMERRITALEGKLKPIVWVLVAVAGASIAAVVQGVVKKMQDRVDPAPAVVNPAEVMGADRKPAPLPPPTR